MMSLWVAGNVGQMFRMPGLELSQNRRLHDAAKAAFDAAQAISRAKTLPEMAHLQSSYLQKQAADAVVQTQAYFELSMKVAQQTIEAMSSAAAKAFDQARKAD